MRLWMLGSGSSGNALLCECGDERILIDCGFGTRTISKRLRSVGADPGSIAACLVTHEHSDHVSGVRKAVKKWGWRVHATAGTVASGEMPDVAVETLRPRQTLDFARTTVEVVSTPHDAAQSVGFVITAKASGIRAAVFYDLGHVSDAIRTACSGADILVIESNHDDAMLRWGPYPRWLQERIASDVGHLSNRHAAELVAETAHRGLQHVVLAHLSENCNTPRTAMDSMSPVLRRVGFKGRLTAAPQDRVVGPFAPRASGAMQLELGM